jgi:tetratricopeptide (TPR) repeat protein
MFLSVAAFGATENSTNFISAPPPNFKTAREFYNAGTQKLRDGKWNDAEQLLESALEKQDERIQPVTLYNLGETRFAQGLEELKKAPSQNASSRSRAAAGSGAAAIKKAEEALAGNDVKQMLDAYMAGRGARKEIRAATEAIAHAMESYGKTLLKWRRALGDFRSAAELNPRDTNAAENARTTERAIAKLVDSLREMEKMAMAMGSTHSRLNGLLQQLKGRIPADMMPPGGAGDDDEDLPIDFLRGQMEDKGQTGQEMEMMMSPEEAGQMLEGLPLDGKLLPMNEGETGKPKNRPTRPW